MTNTERRELTAAELDLVTGGMHIIAGGGFYQLLEPRHDQSAASIIGVLIGLATARAAA